MLELLGDDGKQGANGSASAGSADDVKLTVQLVDALAIEGKWLLISGHVEPLAESPASGRKECHGARTWIDWDDLYSVLTQAGGAGDFVVPETSAETSEESDRAKCRPFCVVELPAEVDVQRCTAVLSDGVIAIRMPKLERKDASQA
jgi:hypothetical protein